jgi:DNA polymerase I-like protein with 3'-5' exonuclease and polymerase domains
MSKKNGIEGNQYYIFISINPRLVDTGEKSKEWSDSDIKEVLSRIQTRKKVVHGKYSSLDSCVQVSSEIFDYAINKFTLSKGFLSVSSRVISDEKTNSKIIVMSQDEFRSTLSSYSNVLHEYIQKHSEIIKELTDAVNYSNLLIESM